MFNQNQYSVRFGCVESYAGSFIVTIPGQGGIILPSNRVWKIGQEIAITFLGEEVVNVEPKAEGFSAEVKLPAPKLSGRPRPILKSNNKYTLCVASC